MNWFQGEVSEAIQKAIGEKKIFIVFVRDDTEQSQQMNELWNISEVKDIFTEEVCVAINITFDSVAGKQFGDIYPIKILPSTFFIENDGIPGAILPLMEKEEFINKAKDLMEVFQIMKNNGDNGQQKEEKMEHNISEEPAESANTQAINNDDQNTEEPSASEKAEALMERVRIKKAEKEKQEVREREQKRRDEGRELSQARRDIAERQAKQLADDIAKKRAEDKAAKERVKEQIRQDREARSAKFKTEKETREGNQRKKVAEKDASVEALKKSKIDSNVTRIQFRLPDGSTTSKEFDSDAKFIVVVEYVSKNCTTLPSARLTTVYPKHEYTQEDHLKSLRDLGLTPNACIIVSRGRAEGNTPATSSLNPISLLMAVLASLLAIITWFFSLLTTSTNDNTSSNTPQQSQQRAANSSRSDSTAAVRRRNPDTGSSSNIRRLHDDKDDEDDNATWNGNSTQQM